MRNAQAYVPKGQQNMVSAVLRQAFTQLDHLNASQTMRHVADQLRDKCPRCHSTCCAGETLGSFAQARRVHRRERGRRAGTHELPAQHRVKIHSTNPIERLNKMGYPGQQACGGFLATAA